MLRRSAPASLAALLGAAALTSGLLVGVSGPASASTGLSELPSLPGLPGGGGSQGDESPPPKPGGAVKAPDQVLRSGCHRYRVNYRVEVPTDEWSAEIFVKNPRGRGIHSFALDSNAPEPKVGSVRFKLCRASTVYGKHRLRMKVTYCPDEDCDEPVVDGFVTPGTFRLTRPARR